MFMLLFRNVDRQHLCLFWNGAKQKRIQEWKRHNIANKKKENENSKKEKKK